MSNANILINNLFSNNEEKLINIKFFLGHDRNVTAEQIACEANLAFSQEASGMLRHNNNFDADLKTRSISSIVF